MNKFKYVLILLASLFLIKGLGVIVVEDLSDYNYNTMYGQPFKSTPTTASCYKTFRYLIYDTDLVAIQLTNNSPNIQCIEDFRNSSAMLLRVEFAPTNLEPGEFQFEINTNSYTYDFPCIAPPTVLDIEVLDDGFSSMRYIQHYQSSSYFYFHIKVNNFVNPQYAPNLIASLSVPSDCFVPSFSPVSGQIYRGTIVLGCEGTASLPYLHEDINMLASVEYSNANTSFSVKSYFERSNSSNTTPIRYISIDTYPKSNDNQNFHREGYMITNIENNGYDLPLYNILNYTTQYNSKGFLISQMLVIRNESNPVFLHYLTIPYGSIKMQTSAYSSLMITSDEVIMDLKNTVTIPIPFFTNDVLLSSPYPLLVSYTSRSDCTWQCLQFLLRKDLYQIFTPGWPYGATNGNALAHDYAIDIFISPSLFGGIEAGVTPNNLHLSFNSIDQDTQAPIIRTTETISIPGSSYDIVRMFIEDNLSGFQSLSGFGDYKNIVQGTVNAGVYDFLVQTSSYQFRTDSHNILDSALNLNNYFFDRYHNLNLDSGNLECLNISKIVSMRFEFNDIDVSNSSFDNRLLIYYSDQSQLLLKPTIFEYGLSIPDYPIRNWFGFYDVEMGCYVIPFTINQNYAAPIFNFFTYLDTRVNNQVQKVDGAAFKVLFGSDSELRIKSKMGDVLGPFITNIAYPFGREFIVPNQVDVLLQWNITIEDPINGLKKGYITIASTLDNSQYNYTFTSWGETKKVVPISLRVNGRCKSQTYYISSVILEDLAGSQSYYSMLGPTGMIPNSLIQVLTEQTIYTGSINTTCLYPNMEIIPPELVSFKFTPDFLDVMYLGKQLVKTNVVKFVFEVSDDSGILVDSLPVIYLQDQSSSIISQKSILFSNTTTTAIFTCDFEVPFGFGFPHGIKVSVYGIVDNQSNFNGYSPTLLYQKGFTNTINVYEEITNNITLIETRDLTRDAKDFIIYGRQFSARDKLVIDFLNGTKEEITPRFTSTSVMAFNALGYKINQPVIHLTVVTGNDYSNTIELNIEQPTQPPPPNDESSNSSSDSGSGNPPTTNSPNPCINNCGGPDHGTCTPNGCICKSPWIDLSCSSQVIIIDPVINSTSPSTTIIVPSNDKDTAIYYSIISIVSLNELDPDNNIIQTYPFPKWIASNNTDSKYKEYTNTSYIYSTSFINNNTTTYINVSIDYFNQPTPVNITFANEVLTMNPYSLKYSINISEYSFAASLNTLQLVLLASIEDSNGNDECSSSQFGETVESNSEYIKMQVYDHSLYGRFIKRGVIDGRVKSITNVPLDSKFNSIKTQSKLQSYIGINVPFFKRQVQLDPDFSVLINNKPASSSSDNALCGENKSKLTKAQIAGIVIGAVAFTAIVITIVTYSIWKTRKQRRFESQVQMKLKSVDKE